MATVVPSTSVEFEVLTTEPAWGDVKEVDLDILHKDGKKVEQGEEQYYKLLAYHTRDFRLGNISHRHDDIEYLEDMDALCHLLLNFRGGRPKLAFLALNRVISTLELSQSRLGFFRRNSKSIHQTGDTTVRESGKSGLNPFSKKNRGY